MATKPPINALHIFEEQILESMETDVAYIQKAINDYRDGKIIRREFLNKCRSAIKASNELLEELTP